MKTLLIGNFGAGNVGDELILSAALEQYPDSIVMTSNPEASHIFTNKDFDTVQFFPTGLRSFFRFLFFASYREDIFSLRNEVFQVVFAGGGLFAIRFRACLLWSLIFWWVKKVLPGIPVRFEYQGIDSHLEFLNKKIVQFVFRRVDFVSVRDESSRMALKYFSEKLAENVGDRVSVFLSQKFPDRNFESLKKENIVLVNSIKPFAWHDFYLRFQSRYKDMADFLFVFVAFEAQDLSCVPQDFVGKVLYPQTQNQIFELFKTARYGVGERFHFLLMSEFFCTSKKSFCLREPYAEKVLSFVKEKGIEKV